MSRHQKNRHAICSAISLNSAIWKDLNAVERAIYVELMYRYNGRIIVHVCR
jgi:hypothetical protein